MRQGGLERSGADVRCSDNGQSNGYSDDGSYGQAHVSSDDADPDWCSNDIDAYNVFTDASPYQSGGKYVLPDPRRAIERCRAAVDERLQARKPRGLLVRSGLHAFEQCPPPVRHGGLERCGADVRRSDNGTTNGYSNNGNSSNEAIKQSDFDADDAATHRRTESETNFSDSFPDSANLKSDESDGHSV